MVEAGEGPSLGAGPSVAIPRPGVERVTTIGSGAGKLELLGVFRVGPGAFVSARLATRTGMELASVGAAILGAGAVVFGCTVRTCTVRTGVGFIGSEEPGIGASCEAITPLVRGAGAC